MHLPVYVRVLPYAVILNLYVLYYHITIPLYIILYMCI